MVKRLFKIKDKEITKDEFYDDVLKSGVSYATKVIIKAIFDKIDFYNEVNLISSRMQITVIYRKMNAMYDSKFHTEYLDFRFYHEEVNRAHVRSINITHLIAMNTKDFLINFHELECNTKDEFDRIFKEFRDKIKINRKENEEMPVKTVKYLFKVEDGILSYSQYYMDNVATCRELELDSLVKLVIQTVYRRIKSLLATNMIDDLMRMTADYIKIDDREYIRFEFTHKVFKMTFGGNISIFSILSDVQSDNDITNKVVDLSRQYFDLLFHQYLKTLAEAEGTAQFKAEHHPYSRQDLIPAHHCPDVERVIFQEPATIVFWKDGSKTVVKVQKGEKYDPEKGLAMAYVKRLLGNCYIYYDIFKKNLPKECRKKAAKSKK